MSEERFLITGATGCIGIWVLRNLLREGISTAVLDHSGNHSRLPLVLTEEEIRRIQFIRGDISDLSAVLNALESSHTNRIIHLAAMLLPLCKADPSLGAQVNVVGTVNIFEAAKSAGIKHVAFASTTAVYGTKEEYPEGPLTHDAPLKPRSHYGIYKQANEGTARVYWLEDRISSIGLRPHVVYGAGRDQGITSTPTKAMLAAAAGLPYRISFGGKYVFQYGDDTAKVFIRAARCAYDGADTFNIGGESLATAQIIRAIEAVEPKARGKITYEDIPLPFPDEVDNQALIDLIGPISFTPLKKGVAETIKLFQLALAEGKIQPDLT
jgi:UDP-glucuronate 4-epimerase